MSNENKVIEDMKAELVELESKRNEAAYQKDIRNKELEKALISTVFNNTFTNVESVGLRVYGKELSFDVRFVDGHNFDFTFRENTFKQNPEEDDWTFRFGWFGSSIDTGHDGDKVNAGYFNYLNCLSRFVEMIQNKESRDKLASKLIYVIKELEPLVAEYYDFDHKISAIKYDMSRAKEKADFDEFMALIKTAKTLELASSSSCRHYYSYPVKKVTEKNVIVTDNERLNIMNLWYRYSHNHNEIKVIAQ